MKTKLTSKKLIITLILLIGTTTGVLALCNLCGEIEGTTGTCCATCTSCTSQTYEPPLQGAYGPQSSSSSANLIACGENPVVVTITQYTGTCIKRTFSVGDPENTVVTCWAMTVTGTSETVQYGCVDQQPCTDLTQ